jgi:hypothetical protein
MASARPRLKVTKGRSDEVLGEMTINISRKRC